jgi:hypothetical protein
MQNIEQLIDEVESETGLDPHVELIFDEAGWSARLADDEGNLLLCPAGNSFLAATGYCSAQAALIVLDQLVEDGYRLMDENFSETPVF